MFKTNVISLLFAASLTSYASLTLAAEAKGQPTTTQIEVNLKALTEVPHVCIYANKVYTVGATLLINERVHECGYPPSFGGIGGERAEWKRI